MESKDVRDVPKLLVMIATLLGIAACVVLAIRVHGGWWALAATVALVGVSVAPKYPPGRSRRWDMPDAVFQAVGLGAVPASVAVALFEGNWWWLAGGALVMVLAAMVSSELRRPTPDWFPRESGRGV